MPTPTFFGLPPERRARLVEEAITEFAERPFAEASLSQIAKRSRIAKGSFYQYFENKLDLYRWLLCDEAPRRKRAFLGAAALPSDDFWQVLTHHVERGMAFLVEHPRLARLIASAADPGASAEVRGLHAALCAAGDDELARVLHQGVACGALPAQLDLALATRWVAAVLGPGLTAVILRELDTELHALLATASLKRRLGPARRQRLAREAVRFLQHGLSDPQARVAARKVER
jgi:AcrR family transcriptional regulator